MLGLVVAHHVFTTFPEQSEGWLSRGRASLVRASTLYSIALDLDLGQAIRLGKGEVLTGGAEKPSILADTVEALIGAVYLDGGMAVARDFVMDLLGSRVDELATRTDATGDPGPHDFKSRLQERCASDNSPLPDYTWTESGPEHAKRFEVTLRLDGAVIALGTGRSKKTAEQDAARTALAILDESSLGAADAAEPTTASTVSTTILSPLPSE